MGGWFLPYFGVSSLGGNPKPERRAPSGGAGWKWEPNRIAWEPRRRAGYTGGGGHGYSGSRRRRPSVSVITLKGNRAAPDGAYRRRCRSSSPASSGTQPAAKRGGALEAPKKRSGGLRRNGGPAGEQRRPGRSS
jgi:hypothetical protein